jgi:molecular chaperone DnaK (HSP70)
MSEYIPIGIDLGSLHARVAIGSVSNTSSKAPNTTDAHKTIVDTQPLPDVISNAQGSRYTLALVGDDIDADTNTTNGQEARHIFGEAARRALAREKKPPISKDPSSLVRELVRSSSSAADKDDIEATNKGLKAVAFFSHLTELACDASGSHPSKMKTVVSVPVNSTPEEQTGIVETVERGINHAFEERSSDKDIKDMKKKQKKDGVVEPYVMAVVQDPIAVAIAHGLTEIEHPGVIDLASSSDESASWKNVLVIDWGASGLTVTHITRTSSNSSLLNIVKTVTDASCSGTSIISTLAKHCASMFERKTKVSGVLDSKKAVHRLEIACESAVRTLSRAPTVTVAVDGLYEGMDMNVPISRPRFDMLVNGIIRKAEILLQTFVGEEEVEFDFVLAAGNVCDMPSATTLIRTKLFPNANAGRGDVPADEAVAIGCARYAASALSCETHSKKIDGCTRKVKTCPLSIGICRIENGKENGDIESVISNTAIPLIHVGEHLPVNVTRKITYNNGTDSWLENSYIAIVQMGKKKKVIGKIEDIELDDKSFEITMELSAAGELTLAVNGEESTTL